ncbi:MAG: NnrS family protein [gamma proteobacterium symbiont of Bathyaustriella thionipta]|nr:NnrS family protein [gamma proteobacterium symbiont of Bathyaustriella thionipta]MCU7950265.1 NnrS family protein [gamma proteobacterium symbiont of Bathyaustriella thionipta]MCU7953403.1 NnrS family protein [gamma proteobacterium symbiont of Bathyaustriella thionipta]MCU7956782.1 NnrS family protein [gamma proteobacterium symbiont of Bathyaustriella thionipta]MCU7967506.1 NnrS family protein [gamma proteobacterium symbiont of Bathyaustriella thionipta]
MFIQIDEQTKQSFALFNLGFRPFFLLSALFAVIFMVLWGLLYANMIQLNIYYGFIDWHSHEMLFGYSAAVIAGFLLTAVRNWTNVDTISKTPLAILAGIWLLARILPFTPAPGLLIAAVDVSFFFFLMLAVAHPIIKVKQWNNLIMVAILGVFMAADILVQSQHLGFMEGGVIAGNNLALYSVLMIIQVLTGRVMPFFTRVVVPDTQVVERPLLEKVLLMTLVLLALADVFALNQLLISLLAGILLVAHTMRVAPWFSRPVLNTPILWVLYAGYLWLLVGFAMKMLVGFELVTNNLAIHAWTVGVIGITTYGMMARVSLGHTGREMLPSKLAVIGFYLLFAATLVRVIFPAFLMAQYVLWIEISSVLWVFAFILFTIAYLPVLTQPRIDGRAG